MRYIRSTVAAALLVSSTAACSSEPSYSRYPYQASAYPGNGYYYANSPARQGYYSNGVYYPPATAYSNPNPYATSDNYYASRSDYLRNYQGIHGGPERTDGARY